MEFLECARYGEVEDLRACLAFGVPVDFRDAGGNSAMHRGRQTVYVICIYCTIYTGSFVQLYANRNQASYHL